MNMFYRYYYIFAKKKENDNFNKEHIVPQQIFVACNLLHTKLQPETKRLYIAYLTFFRKNFQES